MIQGFAAENNRLSDTQMQPQGALFCPASGQQPLASWRLGKSSWGGGKEGGGGVFQSNGELREAASDPGDPPDRPESAVCGRMIAAFGSGASYSLVSGITQGNPFQGAFTTGVLFAAFQGALHKVPFGHKFPGGTDNSVESGDHSCGAV